jgi:hypothetical protein
MRAPRVVFCVTNSLDNSMCCEGDVTPEWVCVPGGGFSRSVSRLRRSRPSAFLHAEEQYRAEA